ncbi:hypothetical protein QTG56_19310 [Rossellomorea sp. AcN35-11]|nr:hypothetical protein [Rossellomorea aquimaris]NMH71406.1 hypothetical protein [Bacillus sp. RO3]WJV29110.1 hypothetical protein QTG56_19310 [Rossellomorea sp. AcN35-11]
MNRNIIFLMTLLSWISMVFLKPKTVKRYIPGALFMTVFLITEGMLAEKKIWWWFHYNIKRNFLGELPLIVGPFFVGSIWILKYTFENFKLYLLTNLIVDNLFVYVLLNWFKKIGYVSLVRLTKPQLSLIFLIKTVSMYAFQLFYEKMFKLQQADS